MRLGNVFILGDSYSTFEGYIPPEYLSWYYNEKVKDTDVDNVEQTWWMQLVGQTESNLLLNCSWSGTTVCNTGWTGDCSDNSFITRIDNLINNGYFLKNKIDTFFVFGGTNDSWCDAPVGELKFADWEKQDLYSVLPAFCYLLSRLKENVNDARIVCLMNCELKESITKGFETACQNSGVEFLQLQNIQKQSGHPNKSGMTQICEQILQYLSCKH